jgi:uncharacterized protein
MATVADEPTAASKTPTTQLLIDTDVHESPRGPDDLKPFLPEHFHSAIPSAMAWTTYALPVSMYGRSEWLDETGRSAVGPDMMAKHLFEQEQVTTAILNGFMHVSAARCNYDAARALARAYNDWQIEHWLNYDERLRGSVHVVADDAEEAAKEIDRVAKHPQIVQVFLPTVTDRQYGDPRYRPIYEAAVRNGLPVSLHHGGHTQTVLGFPRYFTEWHTMAAPQAGMNQIMSIVVNGTFDRYPELKVVLLETGVTWLPWFMRRLDQQYREGQAAVPWLRKLPSEHMRDSVRLATQPMGDCPPSRLAKIAKEMDAEGMYLFATDYPHYDADSVDTTIPMSLGEFGQRVRWRNAVETFPRLNANGLQA